MRKFLRIAAMLIFAVNIILTSAGAESAPKLVALTFDDGPHRVYTAQLLDGLKERGVSATFFMLGQCAQENQELVLRAWEEGHEIACHTWSHPDLNKLSPGEIAGQISRCTDLFDSILGEGNEYLVRPPYGNANRSVRASVEQVLIFWSVDTLDWKLKDEELVYQKIVSEVHDGAIILCHDIHSTTIPAALRAVDALREQGYEFVTDSELFRRRGVEPVSGKLYDRCSPGVQDPGGVPEPVIRFEAQGDGSALVTIDSEVGVLYSAYGETGMGEPYREPFLVEDGTLVEATAVLRANGGRSRTVSARWKASEVPEPPSAPRRPAAAPQNRREHRMEPAPERQSALMPLVFLVCIGLCAMDIRHKQLRRRRRAARKRCS